MANITLTDLISLDMLEQISSEADNDLGRYRVEIIFLDILKSCLKESKSQICPEKHNQLVRLSAHDDIIHYVSCYLRHYHGDGNDDDYRGKRYGVLPHVPLNVLK